jgi:hypothetical protein
MAIVIDQRANVRGIGTQAVFGDDEFEMWVILAQLGEEALRGIAFAIVFLGAILLDDGLGHQRNDLAPARVQQDGTQHLVGIGHVGGLALMVAFRW